MKVLCLISILLFAAIGAKAQCVSTPTDNCVSVHQSILDRSAKAIDELVAAKAYIDTLLKQTAATDAERAAYKNLTVVAQDAIGILQKGIADRDSLIALQSKTLELYATLVEKLTTQLNKPKSGFAKLVAVLRDVALIAAGITFGRGGL